jgi:hypothetical protein
MIYTNPKTLFEQKIQNILKPEQKNLDVFESIFKLQQFLSLERTKGEEDPDNWKPQISAFNTLGMKDYVKIFSPFWGKTISFPTEEEFKESLVIVLCYYYKNIENKEWAEIRDLLNMPDLNTIKYGIRVRQLEHFITQQTLQTFVNASKKGK